jgi:HAE1 family hydrophobic/amphiphilic exporter-1
MSSTSTSAGVELITVTFEVGYDLDIAAVDVVDARQPKRSHAGQLPEAVQRVGVNIAKQSTNMTGVVSRAFTEGNLRQPSSFRITPTSR